jgi:protoporphyrin/coproporphyrin ferrochelatase
VSVGRSGLKLRHPFAIEKGHKVALGFFVFSSVDCDGVKKSSPEFLKCLFALRDVDEIYALPLYPHHSSTTTLSSMDDLERIIHKHGIKAELKTLSHYYKQPDYLTAMLERIQESLGDADPSDFELIFSAHGLPQKIIDKGDLYQRHIKYNVYHARKALLLAGVHFKKTHLAYQSRLGPMEWIRPYLDDKLKSLKSKKVIIYPIAFTIDNSETEFELDVEYREIAESLGFIDYRVAKAPNDHPAFVDCIVHLYESLKAQS